MRCYCPKWLKSTKIEQSWQKSNKDEQNRKAGLQFKNMQFNFVVNKNKRRENKSLSNVNKNGLPVYFCLLHVYLIDY